MKTMTNGLNYKGKLSYNYANIIRGKVTMYEKLVEIIVEQLGVDPSVITPETDLVKDLEADSLDAVEIIMAMEGEYDIEIPDEEAENFRTVQDILDYVEANV